MVQSYKGDVTIPVYGTIADADVYLKADADKVIIRLKAKLAHKGISNKRLETEKNYNWRKYCRAMAECRDAQARLFQRFASDVMIRQLNGFQPAVTVEAMDRRANRCQLASKLWATKAEPPKGEWV